MRESVAAAAFKARQRLTNDTSKPEGEGGALGLYRGTRKRGLGVCVREREKESNGGKGWSRCLNAAGFILPSVLEWRVMVNGGARLPTPCASEVHSVKLSRSSCIISVESL